MKSSQLSTYAIFAFCAVAAGVLIIGYANNVESSSFPMAPVLTTATTSTSVAVTTSVRILATTTNTVGSGFTRAYATICNVNANPVYLNFDNDRPANLSNATYVIATAAGHSACFELTDQQMIYVGSVTASSTNQTSTTITVKEYVY